MIESLCSPRIAWARLVNVGNWQVCADSSMIPLSILSKHGEPLAILVDFSNIQTQRLQLRAACLDELSQRCDNRIKVARTACIVDLTGG